MSLQILALFLVMLIFGAVVGWVYAPGNKSRMRDGSRLPFDDESSGATPDDAVDSRESRS